eukprot:3757408-Alexandrium_andersonii.AAC.1
MSSTHGFSMWGCAVLVAAPKVHDGNAQPQGFGHIGATQLSAPSSVGSDACACAGACACASADLA